MTGYSLRSISFVAELVMPKANHPAAAMNEIHHKAFQDPTARYANFQILPGGVQLSNPVAKSPAASNALILPDRIRIQEQNTGISREEFRSRVVRFAELAMGELQIPIFVAQQFLVQSLINPKNSESSTGFLASSVLKLESNDWEPFGQAAQLIGLRFRFPYSEQHQGVYHVRVENYVQDPRSLFLENTGVFQEGVRGEDLAPLGEKFDRTIEYLEGPLLRFIRQFDGQPEV